MRITIAGAGIGGLAAAALLHDAGHDVSLCDQFDAPRPVGSGLVIQPVGQAVLDRIGVGESARSMGQPIRRMKGHEADRGRPVLDVLYDRGDGRFGLALHRATLFDLLYRAVTDREVPLRNSAHVTGRAGQRLAFADGSLSAPADLLVDASGAGSTLSPLRARPLPYGAVWGTVNWPDTELPADHLTQCYRRADRMMGALPIGRIPGDDRPKAAIFWSLPASGYEAWRAAGLQAWKDEATALWPDFAPFIAQVTDPDQMTMARYSHGTLGSPTGDGIAHIGDAAHRASPQLGQGANMALLDALALARALERHPLDDALRGYAMGRRAHVRAYQAMSAAFTPQYQSDSRWLPSLRDRVLFPISQVGPIPRVLTALVCGTMLPPLGSLGALASSGTRTDPKAPASRGT